MVSRVAVIPDLVEPVERLNEAVNGQNLNYRIQLYDIPVRSANIFRERRNCFRASLFPRTRVAPLTHSQR